MENNFYYPKQISLNHSGGNSGGGRQSLWQNFLISAYPAPLLALEKDVLALFQVTISKVTEISATAE
jgi:hypothetical protein